MIPEVGRGKEGFSSGEFFLQGVCSSRHFDFRLPASKTVRKYTSVVCSPQFFTEALKSWFIWVLANHLAVYFSFCGTATGGCFQDFYRAAIRLIFGCTQRSWQRVQSKMAPSAQVYMVSAHGNAIQGQLSYQEETFASKPLVETWTRHIPPFGEFESDTYMKERPWFLGCKERQSEKLTRGEGTWVCRTKGHRQVHGMGREGPFLSISY